MRHGQKVAKRTKPAAPPCRGRGRAYGLRPPRARRRAGEPPATRSKEGKVEDVLESRKLRRFGRSGAPSRQEEVLRSQKRVCKFTVEKIGYIDFKDVKLLSQFVPERAKILRAASAARRPSTSGSCDGDQRPRYLALLPYVSTSEVRGRSKPPRLPSDARPRRRRGRAMAEVFLAPLWRLWGGADAAVPPAACCSCRSRGAPRTVAARRAALRRLRDGALSCPSHSSSRGSPRGMLGAPLLTAPSSAPGRGALCRRTRRPRGTPRLLVFAATGWRPGDPPRVRRVDEARPGAWLAARFDGQIRSCSPSTGRGVGGVVDRSRRGVFRSRRPSSVLLPACAAAGCRSPPCWSTRSGTLGSGEVRPRRDVVRRFRTPVAAVLFVRRPPRRRRAEPCDKAPRPPPALGVLFFLRGWR